MRQLPKAIPELDGGLFLPRPVVELLEAVLIEHERALRGRGSREASTEVDIEAETRAAVLAELRTLLRLTGPRLALPAPRELLGLADPRDETLRRNLLRG